MEQFGIFPEKSLNLLTRKLNGKNPDWTEDRKNYDQVSPVHENLRKSTSKATTKVRPNYDQGGQKIENFKDKLSWECHTRGYKLKLELD